MCFDLTLLHSESPKFYAILVFLNAIGLIIHVFIAGSNI